MRTGPVKQPRLIVLFASVLLLAGVSAAAQDPEPSAGADWIELRSARAGRTPQEQTEVHVLHSQATSSNRSMQLRAIARVENLIEENDPLSRFPEVTEIISLLVLEPYRVEHSGGARQEPGGDGAHPLVRLEAVRLLGRMGGPEAYEVILELLRVETDDTIRAAALAALPDLEVRPGPELPGLLAHSLRRSRGNPAAVRASLSTVRALHERYGFMDDPALFTEIIEVAQGPYSRGLRQEAYDLVELLRE
jgi:HEAT repeat protein